MSGNEDVEKVQKEITRLSAKFKANTLSGIDKERWEALTEALAAIANPELKNENVKSTARELLDAGLQEFKALVEKAKELEQEKSEISKDSNEMAKNIFKSTEETKDIRDADIRDVGTLISNTFTNCKNAVLDFVEKQKENIVHFSGEVSKSVNEFGKESSKVGNDRLTIIENKAIVKLNEAGVKFQEDTIRDINATVNDIKTMESPFIQMEKALDKGHDLIGKAADFIHKKSIQAKNISTAVKDVANGTNTKRISVEEEMKKFKNSKVPSEYKHKILDSIIKKLDEPVSSLEARKTIANDKIIKYNREIQTKTVENENLKEDISLSLTRAKEIVKEFPENVKNRENQTPGGSTGDSRGD